MRPEILKFIEESTEDKVIDIGFGNFFFLTSKAKATKAKINQDYIKIWHHGLDGREFK